MAGRGSFLMIQPGENMEVDLLMRAEERTKVEIDIKLYFILLYNYCITT